MARRVAAEAIGRMEGRVRSREGIRADIDIETLNVEAHDFADPASKGGVKSAARHRLKWDSRVASRRRVYISSGETTNVIARKNA